MLLICVGLLAGCEGMNNQDVGVVSGGVIGGLIGSRFGGGSGRAAAIAGGTIVGAFLGSRIGETMDKVDRAEMNHALEDLPTGHTKRWTNPDSHARYTVKPTKTYTRTYRGDTQPCREYVTTALIGGKKEQIYGRACRMDDGNWKIIS